MPMPARAASSGEAKANGFAVQRDLSRRRREEAAQDVHQGGFARAVLAEQSVDLSRLEVKVHAVEGQRITKALRDPAHRQGRGGHVD